MLRYRLMHNPALTEVTLYIVACCAPAAATVQVLLLTPVVTRLSHLATINRGLSGFNEKVYLNYCRDYTQEV
jgi:hypothetical protein